jgi:hypothetical protein
MLFREIRVFYSDNNTKTMNMICLQNAGLLIVKAGDAYSWHSDLKG